MTVLPGRVQQVPTGTHHWPKAGGVPLPGPRRAVVSGVGSLSGGSAVWTHVCGEDGTSHPTQWVFEQVSEVRLRRLSVLSAELAEVLGNGALILADRLWPWVSRS